MEIIKGQGIGHGGMTCQNDHPSEELSNASNCEAKEEVIKMAKNPIGNTKRRLSEETMKYGEELRSQKKNNKMPEIPLETPKEG